MGTAQLGKAILGKAVLGKRSSVPIFITDRTQDHVNLLKRLRRKGWANMTSQEKELWYGEAAKGAYNYTDLNRVESAVAELAPKLGLTLTTKTDWTQWDILSSSDRRRYIANIREITDACELSSLPYSKIHNIDSAMQDLHYYDANLIETILLKAYEICGM